MKKYKLIKSYYATMVFLVSAFLLFGTFGIQVAAHQLGVKTYEWVTVMGPTVFPMMIGYFIPAVIVFLLYLHRKDEAKYYAERYIPITNCKIVEYNNLNLLVYENWASIITAWDRSVIDRNKDPQFRIRGFYDRNKKFKKTMVTIVSQKPE